MDLLAFLVALAVIPLVFLGFWIYSIWQLRKTLPPGPHPLPLLGNALMLNTENIQKRVYEISKVYGPIITLWFSNKPVVIVHSIEAANEYLIRKGKLFAGRPQSSSTKLYCPKPGGILMADYHDIWRTNRRLSHGYFNPSGLNIDNITDIINDESKYLIKNIENLNGKPFFPKMVYFAVKLNVTMRLMFGLRYEPKDKDALFLNHVLEMATKRGRRNMLRKFIEMIPLVNYFELKNKKEAGNMFLEVAEFMKKRFAEQEATYNPEVIRHWADAMIKHDSEKGGDFRYQWAPCACDLFIAGVDSSQNTLLWATQYLGLYPEIQSKLYSHITSIVKADEQVNGNDHMMKLPLLQAFIHETLRLSCVTSFGQPHKTLVKTTLEGYSIDPGMLVMTNVYALHHDEKYWDEPYKFMPERFIDSHGRFHIANESFLPFSAGMRGCVGENLAKLDLFGIVGNLIKTFEFTFSDGGKKPQIDGRREISWSTDYYEISAKKR